MIIAVDFDGILTHDNAKFPTIGTPNYPMINLVKTLIREGHEVILWTSRVDQPLYEAVKWCDNLGIKFTAINENAPSNIEKYQKQYPNGTRKIYADIYIDDHSPDFVYTKRMSGEEAAMDMVVTLTRRAIYG